MCNNCYHTTGRDKKAWKCEHLNKSHYAKGLCLQCYQANKDNKKKAENNNENDNDNNEESNDFIRNENLNVNENDNDNNKSIKSQEKIC